MYKINTNNISVRWRESGTDPIRAIAGYVAMRRSCRLSNTSSITPQPFVNSGCVPFAWASLRIWILGRKPTSRLSTDLLVAWNGWEVLRFHQCSRVLPFLFCFVCVSSSLPILRFLLHLLSFSYPLCYPSFPRTLYNGSIRPPGTVLVSVEKSSKLT